MKRLTLLFATLTLALLAHAQTGIHIQQYITDYHLYNKDSLYMTFAHGNMRKMAIVNPVTKAWAYVNTADYANYVGPFTMRTPQQGAMIHGGNAYRTTDGWQTITQENTTFGIDRLTHSDAGYIGLNSYGHTIYFTPDGSNWQVITNPGSSVIASTTLMAVSGNTVILSNADETHNYQSTDGGQTWNSLTFSGFTYTTPIVSLELHTPDTIVISNSQFVWISNDAGTSWVSHALPVGSVQEFSSKSANQMICHESGTGQTYMSSNGGMTWTARGASGGSALVYAGDELLQWPNLHSSDNGVTWTPFLQNFNYSEIYDVHFRGNLGLIGIYNGLFTTSLDQGRSVQPERTVTGTSQAIMATHILSDNTFLAGDRNGRIFRSTDMGATWTQGNLNGIPNNPYKFSVSADEQIIVASCGGQPNISTDNGVTFTNVTMGGGSHVQGIKPNGTILDAEGYFDYHIFRDIGVKISEVTPTGNRTVVDSFIMDHIEPVELVMIDDNVGYLFAMNDSTKATHVFKTNNGFHGGLSLHSIIPPLVSGTNSHLRAKCTVQTFGADTLVLIGDLNTQYHKSVDGGATWTTHQLDIHAAYPTLYPSLRGGYFFTPTTFLMLLNDTGMYLNTSGAGSATAVEMPQTSLPVATNMLAYPNPAQTEIRLRADAHGPLQVQIYNSAGSLRASLKVNEAEPINIADLPAGVYFIIARDGKGLALRTKFVKQ